MAKFRKHSLWSDNIRFDASEMRKLELRRPCYGCSHVSWRIVRESDFLEFATEGAGWRRERRRRFQGAALAKDLQETRANYSPWRGHHPSNTTRRGALLPLGGGMPNHARSFTAGGPIRVFEITELIHSPPDLRGLWRGRRSDVAFVVHGGDITGRKHRRRVQRCGLSGAL